MSRIDKSWRDQMRRPALCRRHCCRHRLWANVVHSTMARRRFGLSAAWSSCLSPADRCVGGVGFSTIAREARSLGRRLPYKSYSFASISCNFKAGETFGSGGTPRPLPKLRHA